MHIHNIVEDLPVANELEGMCKACQFGKQSRLPFPISGAWRAAEKLQLIHIDVCGPMSEVFLNDNKYFVIFINDFFQNVLGIFLKAKIKCSYCFC